MQDEVYRALVAASGVGESTAARVAARFDRLEDIAAVGTDGLRAIPGIGAALSAKIVAVAAGPGQRPRRRRRPPPDLSRGRAETAAVDAIVDEADDDLYGPVARAARTAGVGADATRRLTVTFATVDELPDDPRTLAVHAVMPVTAARALLDQTDRLPTADGDLTARLDPYAKAEPSRPTRPCLVCRNGVNDLGQRYPLCARHLAPETVRTRGGHGLRRALAGCRCGRCLTALDDTARLVADRVAGTTLQRLADARGRTRERIRQVTVQAAPWLPWDAAATEARSLADEIAAVARETTAGLRDPCRCCGGLVFPPRQVVCSAVCDRTARALERHVDPDRYRSQRRAVAQTLLRRASPDETAAWARRVADGTAAPARDRAVFIEGSHAWAYAVAAVRAGWPIADRLHPDAARQLWGWIDAHPDADPHDHVDEPDPRLADRAWLRRVHLRQGWTRARIARETGVCAETVNRALEGAGVPHQSPVRHPQLQDRDWLVDRTQQGLSDAEIGALIGASHGAVHSARRRLRVPSGRAPHTVPPPLEG